MMETLVLQTACKHNSMQLLQYEAPQKTETAVSTNTSNQHRRVPPHDVALVLAPFDQQTEAQTTHSCCLQDNATKRRSRSRHVAVAC